MFATITHAEKCGSKCHVAVPVTTKQVMDESFLQAVTLFGFSLYSIDRASALQTVTQEQLSHWHIPVYVHISRYGHHTVSLVGIIHSLGPNSTMLYEYPTAPSCIHTYIHTYRCSEQVSSQKTSDMNPTTAQMQQWTYALAYITAYKLIYHELQT